MKSKIAAMGLIAALSMAAGLPAQERPEPEQLASGTIFKTLLVFNNTDGSGPEAALVQGTDGNFYGTTVWGGAYNQGTVFKITPGGALTTLYSFCAVSTCPDGNDPVTAMILGTDGNFYGTTDFGGPNANPNACPAGLGCGTIFRITPAGALTTIYNFCAQPGCTDGAVPGPLVQGIDGNLYGETARGGRFACETGCGTIFKITPAGALTTLYSFNPDGYSQYDSTGLVQATDGNFYGTTGLGGSGTACADGCGTIFRMTPAGVVTTLHNFDFTDGAGPSGTLIQAADGNLYGTTGGGGIIKPICGFEGGGCGTAFKMTLQGALTRLADFNSTDGSTPLGLVQAANGNFYGVTEAGSIYNYGVAFEMTPQGVLTRLLSFEATSGVIPYAGLLEATNGTFYGTTSASSLYGYGVIYSLSAGLGPFVESVPPTGTVGTTVKILGNNLKFTTGVTFNGVAAAFTVESSTYIKATVPAGATTGPVQVTLPNGTLTSNVSFQVLP